MSMGRRIPGPVAPLILLLACGRPPAPEFVGPAAPNLSSAPNAEARRWVDHTIDSLTLREKVGQLVMVWIPGGYASARSDEFERLTGWVAEQGIGGVAISIGLPDTYAAKLNRLQRLASVPLLVVADFESGGPGMRLGGVYAVPHLLSLGGGTMFPPTMAFGAIADERFAYELGRITGIEARAVGVHLTLAPVLDVNSNPENPIINTRSFGEDPQLVARLGTAFIRGAHSAGLLTTAKHFPGHGDTRTDSHIELPAISATRERLDSLELVPFRRAIDVGVDAVMTAHIAAPAILGPDSPPATLSPYFLTRLLREDLGFGGVVLTDALRMGAIVSRYGGGEAAVRALEAGADVILSPASVGAAIDAVTQAVVEGRLSQARIDASLRRVLELKARAGLQRGRLVDLESLGDVVGQRTHLAFADTAAARSITLPRDGAGLVPIDTSRVHHLFSLTFADRADAVAGRAFNLDLAPHFERLDTAWVSYATNAAAYDSLAALADSADLVLVSVYVSPRAGTGSVALPAATAAFVRAVSTSGTPTALLSFGSPYLLREVPEVGTYLLAWGGREVSQRAAARALLGGAPITGRLPISIPPHHRAGEGLRRPARLEVAVPAEVGMSASGLARVDSIIEAAIADSATPGAALAIGRHGRMVRLRGYGRLDWDAGAPAVNDSSVYDLASLTKVVGTTTAIMLLVEEAKIDVDAEVVRYLDWWKGGGKDEVTVRQLLLHRGGLPGWLPFWREMRGRAAYREALATTELEYAPGDSTVYSDLGFMTLGLIVEAVSGKALNEFLAQRVFGRLGMPETGFTPDPSLRARIAPTEVDTVLRFAKVHGVVHDENAYAMGGVAGHAGLFASARDLSVYAQMMLDGGVLTACRSEASGCDRHGGARVLAATTIRQFTSRYDSASSRALGWDTPSIGSSAGDYMTPTAFGHTGFTGTSLWIDPELDVFVVLLTNRVNPTRENRKHLPLRRAVHDAVAQAITDVAVIRRSER